MDPQEHADRAHGGGGACLLLLHLLCPLLLRLLRPLLVLLCCCHCTFLGAEAACASTKRWT